MIFFFFLDSYQKAHKKKNILLLLLLLRKMIKYIVFFKADQHSSVHTCTVTQNILSHVQL